MDVIIAVDGSVEVAGADDFAALAVRSPAELSAAELDGLLAAAGWGSAESAAHAWLRVDALERAVVHDERSGEGLSAMLAYAGSRGWLRGDPPAVRAHVEPATAVDIGEHRGGNR